MFHKKAILNSQANCERNESSVTETNISLSLDKGNNYGDVLYYII